MPTTSLLTLADLEDCRYSIIECIAELQEKANQGAKELRTLKSALGHIEEMIKNFKPDSYTRDTASCPGARQSAA